MLGARVDLEDGLRPYTSLLIKYVEGVEVDLDLFSLLAWEEGRDLFFSASIVVS